MPFLKMSGMIRQVKEAYKYGNLRFGATEDYTVIFTNGVLFAVKEESEPNRMKALITEYAGYNPVHDPVTQNLGFIEIGKESGINELDPKLTKNVIDTIFTKKKLEPYFLSPVMILEDNMPVRIIQHAENNKCLGIRQEYLDIITYKELDYAVEGEPIGPEVDEGAKVAYFHNSTTRLAVSVYTFSKDKIVEIVKLLQLTELREDKQ